MKAPVNSSILLSVASYSREQKQLASICYHQLASICYHQLMHPSRSAWERRKFQVTVKKWKGDLFVVGLP
jgi:adenylate cyclase